MILASRVYPISALRSLPLETTGQRLNIPSGQSGPGWSDQGISEDFPLSGARSLYGATKLASEPLLTEYAQMYGIRSIVNRCSVLTGPWQMGKVDQGVVVHWAARHVFGGELASTVDTKPQVHVEKVIILVKKLLQTC